MSVTEVFGLPFIVLFLSAVACGIIGVLTVVRRNTYVAGAVSHSILAGLGIANYCIVVMGFDWLLPQVGALIAACVVAIIVACMKHRNSERSTDAMMSAIWAVGMAIGLCFMSLTPGYKSDLMSYMFGSMALVSMHDIWLVGVLDCIIIFLVYLFRAGIISVSFNSNLLRLNGGKSFLYELIISLITALAIVVLVKTVGIVLVIAMITLPAMASLCLCRRLVPAMVLAMFFCLLSSCVGLALSYFYEIDPASVTVIVSSVLLLVIKIVKKERKVYV